MIRDAEAQYKRAYKLFYRLTLQIERSPMPYERSKILARRLRAVIPHLERAYLGWSS